MRRAARASRRLALTAALLAATAGGAQERAPPTVRSGVVPAEVTVGDTFRSVVEVVVSAGGSVAWEDMAALPDGLEQITPPEDLAAGGAARRVYTLRAWSADSLPPLAVIARIRAPGGAERTLRVPLRLPRVSSVLPADTTGLRPKPARGVFDAGTGWLPLAFLLAALLLLALLAWLLWRRRRRSSPEVERAPVAAAPSARERALALLREAGTHLDEPDAGAVYEPLAEAVRTLLRAAWPAVGPEVTTPELRARREELARAGVAEPETALALLDAADRVKFAARNPPPPERAAELRRAGAWVEDGAPGPDLRG
ncbi:MAG: hypothetical protein ACR2F9_08280 [Longimicrobiaceae bacterium]